MDDAPSTSTPTLTCPNGWITVRSNLIYLPILSGGMESNDSIVMALIIPKRIARMAAHNQFKVVPLEKCLCIVGPNK